jgi:parallel beta-helix repeat protein
MAFVPLYQDGENLLFADLRGQFDDQGGREGNWGLGLRSIVTDDLILGGYGFYDHRWSNTGNTFNQITIGGELKTYVWDLRVNGYLAEKSTEIVGPVVAPNPLNPRAVFADNTILLLRGGPGSQVLERAYSGVDFEVGALISTWGNNNDFELRSFTGGYYFGTNADGFPSVIGPRTRLELRSFDLRWLGEGSRLTIGAEYAWDQVRNSQFNGVVRVQVPLNFRRPRRQTPFRRRMLDRVQRDVDIVTQTGFAPEQVENTVYADNGEPVGPVSLADANRDLQSAVAGAGPGSTVIVDGSRGVIHTASPTFLHNGQTVRGAGFQVRGVQSGAVATFGTRPVIVNSNPSADAFVVADDTTIKNLDIQGGRAGISSDPTGGSLDADSCADLNNVWIIGNQVSDADIGFLFKGLSGSRVGHNQAIGNRDYGFRFVEFSHDSVATENLAEANGDNGFYFDTIDNSRVVDNAAIANGKNGLVFGAVANSRIVGNMANGNGYIGIVTNKVHNSRIEGNTANGNVESGFVMEELTGDDFTNSYFRNNTANGNGVFGIFFITKVTDSEITGNTANGNGEYGVAFLNSFIGSSLSYNKAYENGNDGFYFPNVEYTSVAKGNEAIGNAGNGFTFGNSDGEFSENLAMNNAGSGFDFYNINNTFTYNRAINNLGDGFYFQDVQVTGKFNHNEAVSNGYDAEGNLVNAQANGFAFSENRNLFRFNLAEGNANNGFAGQDGDDTFEQQPTGNFSGNTANDNGDRGYRGENNGGTVNNNTGTGNAGGDNTFP